MIFSGLNTYESTQIKDNESQYPLNCSNINGKLKREDYKIPFAIPDVRSFQRDYNTMDFDDDTSETVGRFTLRYKQDELGIPATPTTPFIPYEFQSGIIKPTVSIFTDTTKEVNNGYLNTVDNLAKLHFNGKSLIGDRLYNTLSSEAKNCEIYQAVEIAISFSGAYGESGLTWFRLPSYTLHGFIFIDNLFETFMMVNNQDFSSSTEPSDYVNPNYKYLNVYIKYGNLENLSLLQRINLTDDETMYKAQENPIELDYIDVDVYGDKINVKKNFYTFYRKERCLYKGAQLEEGEMTDEFCENNNFISLKGQTMCVYTGLFQFENPEKINYSWFVTNRVQSISPKVEVETQTFLSDDDYDELNDKYEAILNEFANNQNLINNASALVPWMTLAGTVDGWDSGRGFIGQYDLVYQSYDTYSKGEPIDFTKDNEECDSDSTSGDDRNSLADVCWYTKFKSSGGESFDMNGQYENDYRGDAQEDGSFCFQTKRYATTGTLIFQYFKEIDGEFNLIETSQYEMATRGSVINTFKLPNFFRNYIEKNENWKIAVWYSQILDTTAPADEQDKNWYKIFDDSAKSIWEYFKALEAGGSMYKSVTSNSFLDFPLYHNTEYKGGQFGVNDITYRGAYPMDSVPYSREAEINGEIGVKIYDLALTLDVGLLYKHKEDILVNVQDPDAGTILDTAEEDIEDILLNADGLYNKDWKALEDGIKIENIDKLNWKYDVRHLEEFDGRIWTSARDKDNDDEETFADLYYSQQSYPEMILPLNYKGYESHITGLHEFIEQLYVFENTQINIVKKHLSREFSGIVEPTYQFHKNFDKGAIEFTIQEYEKKLFFTNDEGQYYFDGSGKSNKISQNIEKLFQDGYINNDTVDYSEIKGEFYVTKFNDKIPKEAFFDIDVGRVNKRIHDRVFDVTYLAFHMKTGTYWLGNDETPFFLYLTKDFDGRDKYGNFSNVKQLKRLSVDYDNGEIGVYQIKNRHFPITYFKYPDQNGYRRPIRHTVKGHRNHFFSFFLSGTDVEIVDMKLLDNVK